MRQIVLDTETTGFDPNEGDRVLELGCVEIVNRELTGNDLHLYFNPDRDSNPGALQVHGLTRAFLDENGQPFEHSYQAIIDYLSGADEIIIHNASFDVKFLDAEFALLGKKPFQQLGPKIVDSLLRAREMFPGKKNSLDALCTRFDISNEHRVLHGALLDSQLLAEVWLAMTRGQFGFDLGTVDTAEQSNALNVAYDKADLSALPVIKADAAEMQAHQDYLEVLDKTSGEAALWRRFV